MRRAALVALALALAGCGSTVQVRSSASLGSDGLGGPQAALDGTSSTGGGTSGSLPSNVSTGTSTGSGSQLGSAAASASSTAPSSSSGSTTATTTTTGVPARSPVRVGVLYETGTEQVASAMGISGLTTGDTKAQAAAIFSWINAHGGLGGHPLAPVYYGIAASDMANNQAQAYQTACSSLAEDGKVRYVITILALNSVALPCFSKHGIGVIDDESGVNASTMAKYASFLTAPGEFEVGRMLKNAVDDLWARGWLTSKSKIGSFAYDDPDNTAVVNGPLTQALAAHGLKITSKQFISNDANGFSATSSASLQFKAANVDRIIPVGASPLFLMNDASSQNYHPWYALYSSFGPGALLEGTAPKDEMAHAAGIGWQPFLDIGAGTHPGPVSSNETLCFALMKGAGQQSSSATVKGFQVQVCNTALYLKAMADRLPGLPSDLFTSSRPLIGTSFPSADTFRTDVTSRVDGAGGFRDLTFDQSCNCFQYTSPIKDAS